MYVVNARWTKKGTAMSDLKIGITLPTSGEMETLERIGGVGAGARHVEQLGFESVWVSDLIIGDGTPSLESIVALATAAAVTDRVHVGFGTLVVALRPIAWVATQIAALQYVSGNRVVLGIGSGGFPGTAFWQAVGVPGRERGRRTDAALEVLPQLIAGEPTRFEHESDQPVVTLAPAARVPPILIGGNSDVAIRRAVTYGDGWLPSLLTPDTLVSSAAKLRERAAERGRATPSITVGTHAMLGNDESARSARDTLVRSLVDDHGLPPEAAALVPITGSPEEVAEHFAAYAAAGAERLVISPDGGEWMRQCELIAEAHALLS
jgi:alkanesulfonate monooxygenase SsuD/methylene tetrahydromethanopterin reductase-like flavin-dependent oxidoreductase (luciferase family)